MFTHPLFHRYTGDTRPCSFILGPGKGADILIHEATFEDALEDEATGKNHSTWSEAIDIANR